MREEFTTEMHAEMFVSNKEEIRNRAFCALAVIDFKNPNSIEFVLDMYQLTEEEMMRHLPEYFTFAKEPSNEDL